jgi:hypothetical protein
MEYNKRATDHMNTLDIEAMISAENDSEKRATLMVLNNINQSLIKNTIAVEDISGRLNDHVTAFRDHRKDFSEHAENEAALLNQFRGSYKIGVWVLGAIQSLIIAAFVWTTGNISSLSLEMHEIEVSVAAYHAKVDQLVSTHVQPSHLNIYDKK